MSCSPKAFKWLSTPETFEIITCTELYCRKIAAKFFLNFRLCITNLVRFDTDQFVVVVCCCECLITY